MKMYHPAMQLELVISNWNIKCTFNKKLKKDVSSTKAAKI